MTIANSNHLTLVVTTNDANECTNDQECLDRGCQECCEHDFDPSEGFICLYCSLQGEPSDVYDEDYGLDR